MARKVTNKLLEMMEEGALDPALLARLALGYMSEDDVRDLAESNELLEDEDLEDDDDEEEEEVDFDAGVGVEPEDLDFE
ncbi:hypothetical protein EBZ80_26500 [bacterium]|nr:hypothetical protein [bacterium]